MFYNNFAGSSYDELISHYPRWYREVYEMKAILNAYGAIFDAFRGKVEVVMANAFVDDADEATVERLEKFFGIAIDRTKTLAERRQQIKFYYAGFGKVSASFLKEMLSAITTADLDITFEPFDSEGNNCLNLLLDMDSSTAVDLSEVVSMLNKWIPAHLKHMIHLCCALESKLLFGIATQTRIVYSMQMSDDVPEVEYVELTDENGFALTDENGAILIV